ncbi:MAG: hypothetical protein ACD_74C00283G0001, partial [uncultured bacterium]
MVNMPHDRDHRRPGKHLPAAFLFFQIKNGLLLGNPLLHLVAKVRGYQGRGLNIKGLIDGGHNPHAQQFGNELADLEAHAVGKITNRNGFKHLDPLLDRLCFRDLQGSALAFAFLAAAPHRTSDPQTSGNFSAKRIVNILDIDICLPLRAYRSFFRPVMLGGLGGKLHKPLTFLPLEGIALVSLILGRWKLGNNGFSFHRLRPFRRSGRKGTGRGGGRNDNGS